jgi:uncharacterized repeat protein (TIGR03987 family)
MHSATLIYAIVFINLACIFYTIGVWSERIQRRLKWWHVIFFFAGLVCDTIGTTAMSILSGSLFRLNFHGITGNIAILLMLFHAIWATAVLLKKNEKMIVKFHRFSILVWIIWLIPMLSGMIFGATR